MEPLERLGGRLEPERLSSAGLDPRSREGRGAVEPSEIAWQAATPASRGRRACPANLRGPRGGPRGARGVAGKRPERAGRVAGSPRAGRPPAFGPPRGCGGPSGRSPPRGGTAARPAPHGPALRERLRPGPIGAEQVGQVGLIEAALTRQVDGPAQVSDGQREVTSKPPPQPRRHGAPQGLAGRAGQWGMKRVVPAVSPAATPPPASPSGTESR